MTLRKIALVALIIGAATLASVLIYAALDSDHDWVIDTTTFVLPDDASPDREDVGSPVPRETSEDDARDVAGRGSTDTAFNAVADRSEITRGEEALRDRAVAEAILDRYRADRAIAVLDALGIAGGRKDAALRASDDAQRRQAAIAKAGTVSEIRASGERNSVSAKPILRSSLPLSVSDRLPRALDRTGDVVPSYRDAAASPGSALDLAERLGHRQEVVARKRVGKSKPPGSNFGRCESKL